MVALNPSRRFPSTAATSPTYTHVYASYIDEPVLRGGSGGLRYYHRNQQYSVIALTDGGGSITERYAYSAYGEPSFFDGSGVAQTGSTNRYTYTGREWDAELSLYHYRARMYDSVSGRFVSRDPIVLEAEFPDYSTSARLEAIADHLSEQITASDLIELMLKGGITLESIAATESWLGISPFPYEPWTGSSSFGFYEYTNSQALSFVDPSGNQMVGPTCVPNYEYDGGPVRPGKIPQPPGWSPKKPRGERGKWKGEKGELACANGCAKCNKNVLDCQDCCVVCLPKPKGGGIWENWKWQNKIKGCKLACNAFNPPGGGGPSTVNQ